MSYRRLAKCLLVMLLLVQASVAHSETPEAQIETLKQQAQPTGMTPERMRSIIEAYAGKVSGSGNNLVFEYGGANLALIFDVRANRMRIISPVIPASELTQEQLVSCMISNYHLALDARYAVGNGLLYSAFVHPMKELTKAQLESAIRQVAKLRNSFGDGYTSGEMGFGLPPSGQET